MNFLKNIKKPFILNPGYNFLGNKGFETLFDSSRLGRVMVKVDEINMEGVQFSIHDIEGIEYLLDILIDVAVSQINTSTEKYKKVVAKILKAWDKSPENFKKQKERSYSSETYINKGLLTDKEYFVSPYYSIAGSFECFNECNIPTGCGGDTYYAPERYKQGLAQVDEWVEKTIKGLKATKSRDKIKKKLFKNKEELFLSFSELDKWISIPVNSEPEKRKKNHPVSISDRRRAFESHHETCRGRCC